MKTVFIFTQSNRGLTQKYLTLTKVFCILHEKPWGSHPSWDQFGHHGKQKIYLLPKIVVKVANWLQIWKKNWKIYCWLVELSHFQWHSMKCTPTDITVFFWQPNSYLWQPFCRWRLPKGDFLKKGPWSLEWPYVFKKCK